MITVIFEGLDPDTDYEFKYENSVNPGTMEQGTIPRKSDFTGALKFRVPNHTTKFALNRLYTSVIFLEEGGVLPWL